MVSQEENLKDLLVYGDRYSSEEGPEGKDLGRNPAEFCKGLSTGL